MSTAPGPGLGVIAHLPRLRRDPLGTMLAWHREYGDVVRLGAGALTVHLLGHPSHAARVLRLHHRNYDRQTRSAAAVRLVTGESLVTNDGDEWRRHRLLMQPLFNKDALSSLSSIVVDATNAMIDRWRPQRDVDLAAEMMKLTSTIACRAFFGTDVDENLDQLMAVILEEESARATSIFGWGGPRRGLARPRARRLAAAHGTAHAAGRRDAQRDDRAAPRRSRDDRERARVDVRVDRKRACRRDRRGAGGDAFVSADLDHRTARDRGRRHRRIRHPRRLDRLRQSVRAAPAS